MCDASKILPAGQTAARPRAASGLAPLAHRAGASLASTTDAGPIFETRDLAIQAAIAQMGVAIVEPAVHRNAGTGRGPTHHTV